MEGKLLARRLRSEFISSSSSSSCSSSNIIITKGGFQASATFTDRSLHQVSTIGTRCHPLISLCRFHQHHRHCHDLVYSPHKATIISFSLDTAKAKPVKNLFFVSSDRSSYSYDVPPLQCNAIFPQTMPKGHTICILAEKSFSVTVVCS